MTAVAGGTVRDALGRVRSGVLGRPLWLAAIAASVGAGIIHLAHGPAHLVELGALGAGFYVAAALQLSWAGVALAVLAGAGTGSAARGTSALAASGIAINGAILAAWLTSRVVGLPAGETPWTPESIGLADGISAILQGLLVVGLVAKLRGWALPRAQRLATAAAAIGMLLIATGTAVAISPSEVGHGHPPGSLHAESDEQVGSGEHAAPEQHADTEEHAATDGHAEAGGPAATDEPSPTDAPATTNDHGEPDPHKGDDEHGTDEHAEDGGH